MVARTVGCTLVRLLYKNYSIVNLQASDLNNSNLYYVVVVPCSFTDDIEFVASPFSIDSDIHCFI